MSGCSACACVRKYFVSKNYRVIVSGSPRLLVRPAPEPSFTVVDLASIMPISTNHVHQIDATPPLTNNASCVSRSDDAARARTPTSLPLPTGRCHDDAVLAPRRAAIPVAPLPGPDPTGCLAVDPGGSGGRRIKEREVECGALPRIPATAEDGERRKGKWSRIRRRDTCLMAST